MIKIICEDIDAVKKQYSYVPDKEFDKIIKLDPTFKDGKDSVGKYGKWLLGLYKKHPDDYSSQVKELLAKYDELKNDRTKTIEKDVMRFKSIEDLKKAIEGAGEATLSKKQQIKQAKKDKPYDLVLDADGYEIYVPRTYEGDVTLASLNHSDKALWCTAADSDFGKERYAYYTRNGHKLYVFINKKDPDVKYQLSIENKEFNDEGNEPADTKEFFSKHPKLAEYFSRERGVDFASGKKAVSDEKKREVIKKLIEEKASVKGFIREDLGNEIGELIEFVCDKKNIDEETINKLTNKAFDAMMSSEIEADSFLEKFVKAYKVSADDIVEYLESSDELDEIYEYVTDVFD